MVWQGTKKVVYNLTKHLYLENYYAKSIVPACLLDIVQTYKIALKPMNNKI